ncbi:MAG TPA: hypothetical protein VGG39_29275 [Polyangiaceae bacterium]
MDDFNRRRESRDAIWLALVPLGVALVLGVLLMPRHAAPESVPLPLADTRALVRAVAHDHALAEHARAQPLPGPVRALGSAVRAFHTLEAHDADGRDLYPARRAVDVALVDVLRGGDEPLLELRAVELEGFLEEMHRFEATGQQTDELEALAGAFVRSLTVEGWCEGHAVAVDDDALRPMFEEMWNSFLNLQGNPAFAPTLDEQRALYAFYLSHAHPTKTMRDALDAARRGAADAKACAAIDEAERASTEAWRLERIGRLAAIDPAYPADYARGVASYRRGDFGASARAFHAWLQAHPEGPLALRAQNFLRAASGAERPE